MRALQGGTTGREARLRWDMLIKKFIKKINLERIEKNKNKDACAVTFIKPKK